MSLLESLVALVIFSLGTLGLVAMYATAVGTASEAQMRADAAALSNDVVNAMWLAVERDASGTVKPDSLSKYALGNASVLAGTGNRTSVCNEVAKLQATPEPDVIARWLERVKATRTGLGTGAKALVAVETAQANRLSVVLCWQSPRDNAWKIHETVAFIN
jgi:Tfp pilus assembly protein PilV